MKVIFVALVLLLTVFTAPPVFAVESAPRISDREIIEKLAKLEEGQASLKAEIANTNKRIDDMNNSVNKRFDILQWMFGLFITAAMVILGFVLNMQWQMQKKQTQMETTLEAQKAEITFVKTLIEKLQTIIEKLIPPRGVL